eukprot:TRINITY_DN143_c0_g1_i1.p1 TRINITY_DN143_c0_g1~~TRINITY_DN143_c0_g1_i1.p1  ORF type:complete len:608 (-),score=165.53 TRINITY_DN143_c0_g1_i1:588-2411(-)
MVDRGLQSQLEIFISAKNLPNKDVASKSDPFVVMSVFDVSTQKFSQLGRSETIMDNLNPEFQKQFVVTYEFESRQIIRVSFYDEDNKSAELSKQDFLGYADFEIGNLVTAPGQFLVIPLLDKSGQNPAAHGCTVTVKCEQLSSSREFIKIRIRGEKLDKKDFFGNADPFLELHRVREDASLVKVHTTEVLKNTLNPFWKPLDLSLITLCNGDKDRPIKAKCFDWNKHSDAELIGEFEFTVNQLLKDPGATRFDLINSSMLNKRKYKRSGEIVFERSEIVVPHSFLDYIAGGCSISLMVAIDFTGSNGDPAAADSLHFRGGKTPNPYQKAIRSIGDILAPYDSDGMIAAWGFGGKMRDTEQVAHDFPINFSSENPEVRGVNGLLEAYHHAFDRILLSGPTYFAPAIATACSEINKRPLTQENQQYAILLILTDGAINDFARAQQVIQRASMNTPLSIVIVGVGNADFGAMEKLDGDDIKDDAKHRDIVQFVPMNKFDTSHISALTKEVLAEIPGQFMSFMAMKGITPNPPREGVKPELYEVKSLSGPPSYQGGENNQASMEASAPSPPEKGENANVPDFASAPPALESAPSPPDESWQVPPPVTTNQY